jgi:SecD/SecF fusion protein
VNTPTVAALLTILGFSLYDTIIVFDRIRENVPRMPRATFSQIVNRSMSEVLTRSLATSASTLMPIAALMLFGGETLKDFGFALLVGVASGTYSSIFIAAPVLTHWKEREPAYRRRRERIEEQMGGVVPAFPEENLVARVDGQEEPVQAETPVPAAPAPSRAEIPGVTPEPSGPVAPPPPPAPAQPEPPAAEPEPEPPAPVGAPDTGSDGGDGRGDGEAPGGNGDAQPDRPELSEASAAALRRVREQQGGGRKRRRKHGRNR